MASVRYVRHAGTCPGRDDRFVESQTDVLVVLMRADHRYYCTACEAQTPWRRLELG